MGTIRDVTGDWQHHLREWDASPHGRAGVGCERCHGGDPTTFNPTQAHREILSSRNPASRVSPARLPETCGTCHPGPFIAFQTSRHDALLRESDTRGPSCTTCHGSVGAHLLSAKALASRCEGCHEEAAAGHSLGSVREARALLDGVGETRAVLREARSLIRRLAPGPRQDRLLAAWQQAEVPLLEAVSLGHSFVFDQSEERLAASRQRAEALLQDLLGGGTPAP